MSGELTARDVIARAHDFDDWVFGLDRADLVLAALDAAGLEVTEKTSQWEWTNRLDGEPYEPTTENRARAFHRQYGGVLLRRRPAGPWRVAP